MARRRGGAESQLPAWRLHEQWIGLQLARLSRVQIRDAFRAAGYPTEELEGFTAVVQTRIAELQGL